MTNRKRSGELSGLRQRLLDAIDQGNGEQSDGLIRRVREILEHPPTPQGPYDWTALAYEVVQAMPIPIVALSRELRVMSVNRAYCSLFHTDETSMMGSRFFEIGQGQFADPQLQRHFQDLSVGEYPHPATFELDRIFPTIGHRVLRLDCRPLANIESPANGLLISIQDVTDLRSSEPGLRRYLQQFASSLHGSPVVVSETDRDLRYIRVYNPHPDFAEREMLGRRDDELSPDPGAIALRQLKRETIDTRRVLRRELTFRYNDGEHVCDIIAHPITGTDGTVIGATTVAIDISEHKRLQRELQEKAVIVESSFDAMMAIDRDLIIRSWNRGAEHMYGFSADEAIGQHIRLIVPEDRRQEPDQLYGQLSPRQRIDRRETVRRRKDGSCINVSLTVSPILDEAGRLDGFAVIAQDITLKRGPQRQLERVNQDLQRRTEELERSNRDLEAFTYSASHDLRAPLRAIEGFSQALWEDYYDQFDEEGRDFLNRIHDRVEHMRGLIEALLRLSRVSRVELQKSSVSLTHLAQRVVRRLKEQDPYRHIAVSITHKLTCTGDRQLLEVALNNLLGNAWKFTAEQPEPRIEFGVQQQHGREVYFVRDNGAGFDPAYSERLFLIFQRLHPESRFPGLGIGLPLVKRIIERHSGSIWAEASVGEGATFYFTIGST